MTLGGQATYNQSASSNHALSWLPKVASWLRKNVLCLSQSAFSNFALDVINCTATLLTTRSWSNSSFWKRTHCHSFMVLIWHVSSWLAISNAWKINVIFRVWRYSFSMVEIPLEQSSLYNKLIITQVHQSDFCFRSGSIMVQFCLCSFGLWSFLLLTYNNNL